MLAGGDVRANQRAAEAMPLRLDRRTGDGRHGR